VSLRTNLATRPFYNEGAVRGLLLLGALVVAVITALNVYELASLTRRDRELAGEAARAESAAQALQRDATKLRTGFDATHVSDTAAAAHEANVVIDQRAFSWTALFNRLEAALPPSARVTAVAPSVDDEGRLTVTVTVLARDVQAIDSFLDALEKTGAFAGLLSQQEAETKDGLVKATVRGAYRPPVDAAPAGGGR
jgi:Tfp pilus assembly protein PilN